MARSAWLAAAFRRPLLLGVWATPLSIAASEALLSVAALAHIVRLVRREVRLRLPRRLLALWLAWAGLETVLWALSPDPARGWSEIRRLLLLAVLFVTFAGLDRKSDLLAAWRGVFLTSTAGSLFVIGDFLLRSFRHQEAIAAGGAASFYLRTGGLHHWMVYGTLEIVVVAGLLSFWRHHPAARRRWLPVVAIHGVAIVLSLTRMVWITGLLLVAIHLAWRRSPWLWALPLAPLVLFALAPGAVRARLLESIDPAYYANAERLQMLQVGWSMVRDHPLTGVGPGRVESLYPSYLAAGEPVPAWHGHLHNNLAQIAAQFGLPGLAAAALFAGVLLRDLLRARRRASSREERFIAETAVLAFTGFLFAGLFEYTYGHSLGLILLTFAVLPAVTILLQERDAIVTPGRGDGDILAR